MPVYMGIILQMGQTNLEKKLRHKVAVQKRAIKRLQKKQIPVPANVDMLHEWVKNNTSSSAIAVIDHIGELFSQGLGGVNRKSISRVGMQELLAKKIIITVGIEAGTSR